MKARWQLKVNTWYVLCVLMMLSTCFVCRLAAAQDNAIKTKIFLGSEMTQSLLQPSQAPETAQPLRPTLILLAPLPFHINVLQYISEKQGRIPVISGMNGKLQLEFGLFGYLGLKYRF